MNLHSELPSRRGRRRSQGGRRRWPAATAAGRGGAGARAGPRAVLWRERHRGCRGTGTCHYWPIQTLEVLGTLNFLGT